MPGVMPFGSLRQEAFTAALTATSQGGTPALGFHSSTETMLTFPCPLGWLISAFHALVLGGADFESGYGRKVQTIVN